MKNARVEVKNALKATVSKELFGSFVEHMGRCVYGGIYDPSDPAADSDGFRTDVLELAREMGVSVVRYPGGNFVSGYNWEDGVGRKADRPKRLDLAWRSIESNQFGLNEFMSWMEKLGAEPIMAMNLGTRGVLEAAQLVEYVNTDHGTTLSELRKSHGVEEPHNVKYWCLGNEMDGPWQIGHKNASDYGKLAKETAKAVRLVDPEVTLVACGSSFEEMPTFGEWEQTVLQMCHDEVDLISLHAYYEKYGDDTLSFLASSARMDRFINKVVDIADQVSEEKRSDKKINLAFDEWNVWYQEKFEGVNNLEFRQAPRLIEDEYTVEDAVVVGSLLMTLLKNSNRVSMACQAQLVNIIGPIRTEPGVPAWRQTTFFPFALTSRVAGYDVLDISVQTETQDCKLFQDLPMVDIVVTRSPDAKSVVIFSLNRQLEFETDLTINFGDLATDMRIASSHILGGSDLAATNSKDKPENVRPGTLEKISFAGGQLRASLPPVSWSVIELAV